MPDYRNMGDVPEVITQTTVTATAQKVGGKVAVSAMERAFPDFADRLRFDVSDYLSGFCHSNHVHALEDPNIRVVVSVFHETELVPAPRRWWHRLLFLHPMEERAVFRRVDGDVLGADGYEFGWQSYVIDVPESVLGSVRDQWARKRDHVFMFRPPAGWPR